MSKHIHIVDGNSIAYANHNAMTLTVGSFQTQAIFGTLKAMKGILENSKGESELLVLWDGRAQFRFDIFPEYKGNRDAMDEASRIRKEHFKKQAPFIEKGLEFLGVKQMRSPLLEADDLAKHLVEVLSPRHPITLWSGDQDWLQLVRKGVKWIDPIRDSHVTLDNFLEFTGFFTTEQFVQGLALTGDGSDNVDGIHGMGDKTAQLFLAEHQDVQSFFAKVDAGTYTPKARKSKTAKTLHHEQILASPEGRALYDRNLSLVDMARSRRPVQGETIINKGTPDADKFIHFCQRFAFASILREMPSFLRAFNVSSTPQHAA